MLIKSNIEENEKEGGVYARWMVWYIVWLVVGKKKRPCFDVFSFIIVIALCSIYA